jgi:hypothetical protein
MARFLHTVLHQDVAITAGGTPLEKNLGVNPISFLMLTIRAIISAANATPLLANLLGVLSNVEVKFQGTSVVSLSLADLHRMQGYLWRKFMRQQTVNDDANTVQWISVPVPFTRVPYWPNEGIPATKSGQLVATLTPAASFVNIGTVTVQLEQVELLDAVPVQFIKQTTLADTPAATGRKRYGLPLGNPILGIGLFGTTAPGAGATTFNASLGQVKVLIDNVETGFSLANWETLRGLAGIRAPGAYDFADHEHETPNAVAAGAETSDVSDADLADRQYAYLDYDPVGDGTYALETEGRGAVELEVNSDVADAIRIVPVELIKLPGAAAPAAG